MTHHVHRITVVFLVACALISCALFAAVKVSAADQPTSPAIQGPQATVTLLATHTS